MKQLIRRFSRVADFSSSFSSSHYRHHRFPTKSTRPVPEGHLPVYVGEEMVRFVVPAEIISRPAFVELLRLSAQEYGYEQRGVLRIPCTVEFFQGVLDLLSGPGGRDEEEFAAEVTRGLLRNFAVHVS